MPNDYYNRITDFQPGNRARSGEVDAELNAVAAGFDKLPDEADLVAGNLAFAGVSAGAGNLYTLTMPQTRLTNINGSEVIFIADKTNTGAVTIQVDAIGAVSAVRGDGNAMTAGDIVSGLIYVFRYDSTNTRFQLHGASQSYLTDVTASAAAAATSASNAATSETNAATSESLAQEWADKAIDSAITGNPGLYSARHWADGGAQAWAQRAVDSAIPTSFGGDGATDYSARHWAQGAEEWAQRAEDSLVPTSFGGDGATQYSAFHWAQKALGAAADVTQVSGTGTDLPSAPGTSNANLPWRNVNGIDWANLGYEGVNDEFYLRNFAHGGGFRFEGENFSGTPTNLMQMYPDSAVTLYYQGRRAIASAAGGAWFYGDFTGNDVFMSFWNSAGSALNGQMQVRNADTWLMRGDQAGQGFEWQGRNVGDTAYHTMMTGDPDDAVTLYYNNTDALLTTATGIDVRPASGTNTVINLQTLSGGLKSRIEDLSGQIRLSAFTTGAGIDLYGDNFSGTHQVIANFSSWNGIRFYQEGVESHLFQNGGLDISVNGVGNATLRLTDGDSQLGQLYKDDAGPLVLLNTEHSGQIWLRADNSVGTINDLFVGNPDGAGSIFYNGTTRIATDPDGVTISGDGVNATIQINDSAGGSSVALITQDVTTGLFIRQLEHGLPIALQSEDGLGVLQDVFRGDPDGASRMYFAGTSAIETTINGADITADSASAGILDLIAGTGQASNIGVRTDNGGWRFRSFATGNGEITQTNAAGSDEGAVMGYTRDAGIDFYYNDTLQASVKDGYLYGENGIGAGMPANWWSTAESAFIAIKASGTHYGQISSEGAFGIHITSNGYRNDLGGTTGLAVNAQTGISQLALLPSGDIQFRSDATVPGGTTPTLVYTYDVSLSEHLFNNSSGVERLRFGNSGFFQITSDDNDFIVRDTTDGTSNFIWRDHDVSRLYLGSSAAEVVARSDVYLGGFQLRGDAGNTDPLLTYATNAAVTLYYNGVTRAATSSGGFDVLGSQLDLDNSAAAGGAQLFIRNSEGGVELRADNDTFTIYQTNSAGTVEDTWIFCANNGAVELRWNNEDALITQNQNATGNTTGAQVNHHDLGFYDVGMNVTPLVGSTAALTIDDVHCGKLIRKTTASDIDITTTSNNIPNGGMVMVVNQTGSNITLDATTVTLTHLTGAGTATGDRTLANGGVATIYKRATSQFLCWGIGLT